MTRPAAAAILGALVLTGCGTVGDLLSRSDAGKQRDSDKDIGSLVCQPGEKRPCYEGPASSRNVGLCKDGVRRCGQDALWGRCLGQEIPQREVCGDGEDNDCDGAVDCPDDIVGPDTAPAVPPIDEDLPVIDPQGCREGNPCDDGKLCTIDDRCNARGACVGQPVTGWQAALTLKYRQRSPNGRWAQRQKATIKLRRERINAVRVSGTVESGGYCYVYWGTGSVGVASSSGRQGVYSVDDRFYSACPDYPPVFGPVGDVATCQEDTGSGTFPPKQARLANLPPGSKLYVRAQHVVPDDNGGGRIKCNVEVRCH